MRQLGFLFIVLAFGVAGVTSIAPVRQLMAAEEEEYRGDVLFKNLQGERSVVVVTGGRSDQALVKEQLGLFKEELEGLKQRKVTLVRFVEDKIFELTDYSRSNFETRKEMNAHQQRYLEQQMHSDNNEFSIVLIGRDGYWAHTWRGANNEDGVYEPLAVTIAPQQIYRTIDRVDAEIGNNRKKKSKR
jgi:hypothetical protein